MPNCENCDCQWRWAETFKLGFKGSGLCPNCKKRQYVSTKARSGPYFFYMIPFITLLLLGPLFNLNIVVYTSLGILLIFILTITLPYTIKLSNERKPLW